MEPRELWRQVRSTDTPGTLPLGPNTFDRFIHDPKRLAFYGARYAFAAKMLRNSESIADIGCGDGFFTTALLPDTRAEFVVGIDFDEELISYANNQLMPALRAADPNQASRLSYFHGDFIAGDDYLDELEVGGLLSMDCIEHIHPDQNYTFLMKVRDALTLGGVAVIGTPNEYAAHLGSSHSKLGHINNHTPESLRAAMEEHFSTVLMFGMNDCMVHVGHEKLWHYIIAIGVKGP